MVSTRVGRTALTLVTSKRSPGFAASTAPACPAKPRTASIANRPKPKRRSVVWGVVIVSSGIVPSFHVSLRIAFEQVYRCMSDGNTTPPIDFPDRARFDAAMADVNSAGVNRRRNLGFFFDSACARTPDKVAVIDLFGGGERQITYRALDARMDRVAAMLARLGVAPGERVGMLVGNRLEFIEFFF